MIKKVILVLITVSLLLTTSCSVLDNIISGSEQTGEVIFETSEFTPDKSKEKVFTIDDYNLQITTDGNFKEDTNGDFDLQVTNEKSYISIMAFKYIDLPKDLTPQGIYDMQNDDLFSKRSNVVNIEESKTQSISNGTLTQALYSAEKDGVKNYYATYLIDFPEKETFAWVLISAMPSYLNDNKAYLHNIVCSLTPNK